MRSAGAGAGMGEDPGDKSCAGAGASAGSDPCMYASVGGEVVGAVGGEVGT